MANKAREQKINETIPDKKGYLDQGFTFHGSPFQKEKKAIIFKQKNSHTTHMRKCSRQASPSSHFS